VNADEKAIWQRRATWLVLAILALFIVGSGIKCWWVNRERVIAESVSPDGLYRVTGASSGYGLVGERSIVRVYRRRADPHFWQGKWEEMQKDEISLDSAQHAQFDIRWEADANGKIQTVRVQAPDVRVYRLTP